MAAIPTARLPRHRARPATPATTHTAAAYCTAHSPQPVIHPLTLPVPDSLSLCSSPSAEAEREAKEAESDRQFSSSVLKRDINWSGFEKMGNITKKELGLLLDYDKQSKSDQSDLLQEKGIQYAALFVKALDAIRTKDTVEYVVILIDSMIAQDPATAHHFHALLHPSSTTAGSDAVAANIDPYSPFLRILQSSEGYHPYVLKKAALILAAVLSTADSNEPKTAEATRQFIRHLVTKLNSSTAATASRDVSVALNALKYLLQNNSNQQLFKDAQGIAAISTLLTKEQSALNAQLCYQVGFIVWLLSYHRDIAHELMNSGIVKRLVTLLKSVSMEKVIRIVVSVLVNLIRLNDHTVNEQLIGLNVLPLMETLSKRKFKDSDIVPDMEEIIGNLHDTITRLSNYDLYHSEVMSGNLQWTPAHKNEIFWRENIARFEERNYQVVSKLIELLADDDDTVREIACWDLGEFARFASEGKRVIGKLGGKAKLMVNLSHKNTKVSKAALLATQKLMVANWEYLAKTSSGGVAALVSKAATKA